MSTYKLVNGVLFKDGVMQICQITPVILKPAVNSLNQRIISMERVPCTHVTCPHFHKDGMNATLKCVPTPNSFVLEKEETVATKQKSNLIN